MHSSIPANFRKVCLNTYPYGMRTLSNSVLRRLGRSSHSRTLRLLASKVDQPFASYNRVVVAMLTSLAKGLLQFYPAWRGESSTTPSFGRCTNDDVLVRHNGS
eukprot:scaffold270982_cov17-Prasinocladus_malaysianus.AAC.1